MAKIKSATFEGSYSANMTAGTVTFMDGTICDINMLNEKDRQRDYFDLGRSAKDFGCFRERSVTIVSAFCFLSRVTLRLCLKNLLSLFVNLAKSK